MMSGIAGFRRMRLSTSLLVIAAPVVAVAYGFPHAFTAMLPEPVGSAAVQAAPKPTAAFVPSTSATVRVSGGPDGHFRVSARIGARRIPFLVDTGASVVALSWETGLDLGLVRSDDTMDVTVATANGTVQAKAVTIDRLEVGEIDLTSVRAIVLPRGALAENLLGMSFLNRLRHFEIAQGMLALER